MSSFTNALSNIESKVEYHEKEINPVLFQDVEMKFGKINIKTGKTEMTQPSQFIYFDLDQSGSMQDSCADGRTKMEHAIHSISNIIKMIVENKELNIWIQVTAFDDMIDTIIYPQKVTEDNFLNLLNKLKRVIPRGGTSIELALNNAKKEIKKFQSSHQEFNITHIFTTDGNPTIGSTDKNILSIISDISYSHIFIGFGLDHSAEIMSALASNKNTVYYFIDKIENGGLVFGEILYKILYVIFWNVTILTNEYAEIYNYKTNEWSSSLLIEDLTSETNRTYHLRSTSPFDSMIRIIGTMEPLHSEEWLLLEEIYLPRHMEKEKEKENEKEKEKEIIIPEIDLTRDIFRHKTLEMIYHSINSIEKSNKYKKQMQTYITQMKKYMSDNDLLQDEMMKSLCDDIYIVIRTYNTEYGNMYACARSNSNGRETSYNVNSIPDHIQTNYCPFIFTTPPALKRQVAACWPRPLIQTSRSWCLPFKEDDKDVTTDENYEVTRLSAEFIFESVMDRDREPEQEPEHMLSPTPLSRHTSITQGIMMREISK